MKNKFYIKQFTLLLKYQEFKDLIKRDQWVRSLPLDQRAILRNAIPPVKNKLF